MKDTFIVLRYVLSDFLSHIHAVGSTGNSGDLPTNRRSRLVNMVADLTTGEVRDLGAILTEVYGSIKGGSAGSGNKVQDLRGQLIG
jgi:hypothetical protein